MTYPRISISAENRKLGNTPSVSMPPGFRVCRPDAPCRRRCYCRKALRLYPQTRDAWSRNKRLYFQAPEVYFGKIRDYLHRDRPGWFRWHVSGEIPDMTYAFGMMDLCAEFPATRFLVFTKRHELVMELSAAPRNLSVYYSFWPGWGSADEPLLRPHAWMYDPKDPDPRIPRDAVQCPGYCPTCRMCWTARRDVVFRLH